MKSNGYTFTELLVVLAIIAILTATLFPMFAATKERARESGCCSNLHQIGSAFNAYVDEYNGRYPAGARQRWAGEQSIHPLQHSTVCTWDVVIIKQVKNIGVFARTADEYRCPIPEGSTVQPLPRSYALNDQPRWTFIYLPAEVLPNAGTWTQAEMKASASRYVLLSEWIRVMNHYGLGKHAYNNFSGRDYCSLAGGKNQNGEHNNGALLNYLFFDGHVKGYAPLNINRDLKGRWGFLPGNGDNR